MRCLNGDFVRLRNGMPTPTGCVGYISTSAREYFSYQREKATVINIINIEKMHALCNLIFFQYLIN